MRISQTFIVSMLLWMMASCAESEFSGQTPVRAASATASNDRLEISPTDATLTVGEKLQFEATLIRSGKKQDVSRAASWSVDVKDRAALSKSGKLTAKAPGSLVVTAEFENLKGVGKATIIDAPLLEIKVSPSKESIGVGLTVEYKAMGIFQGLPPRDITEEVTWTSGDMALAIFSQNPSEENLLQTVAPGSLTITASLNDLSGDAVLDVIAAKIDKILIKPADGVFPVGELVSYDAVAIFSDGSEKNISSEAAWTSDASDIVTFQNEKHPYLAETLKEGRTIIRASYLESHGETSATVGSATIKSLAITPASAVIKIGASQKFHATATYSDDTVLDVTSSAVWGTLNSDIATVSNASSKSGEVVGIASGETGVTATYKGIQAPNAGVIVQPVQTFALSVAKVGAGTGTVTGTGIACGADCSETFNIGTAVTLTAVPSADSVFSGWSGSCNGSGACSLTMDTAKSVTANFTLKTMALSVGKTGNGSGVVSGSGINCGSSCSTTISINSTVTLNAAPSANSSFVGWSGACSGTGSCVVKLDAAKTVTANFVLKTFPLTVAKSGSGSGTVTGTGISCGSDCSETLNYGTVVNLKATPATDSLFTGWSGACTGTGTCSVTMEAAKAVTANFVLKSFVLNVSKTGNGSGTVTGSGISCGTDCNETFNINTNVSLTATAAANSVFTGWSGACSGTGSCSVTLDAAKHVTATFVLKTFALTVSKAGSGTGTVSGSGISCGTDCSETFNISTNVTLTATPAPNAVFVGWGGACSGSGTCSVSMSQAQSVSATFDVNCDTNAVELVDEVFRTPLTSKPYTTGDMGRKSLDGTSDKSRLQQIVNQQCIDNFDPTVDATAWTNPVLSSDVATRNAICQLYGYKQATGAYGYYKLSSPDNDHAATWNSTLGRMVINLDAAKAPTNNQILVWTECKGKLYNSCSNKFVSDFRCKN